TELPSRALSLLLVLYGIRMARTFSGPSALTAKKQETAESIPPDSPTTTRENPALLSSSRMKLSSTFPINSQFSFISQLIFHGKNLPWKPTMEDRGSKIECFSQRAILYPRFSILAFRAPLWFRFFPFIARRFSY